MTLIKILVLIISWIFFYKILKSKNKRLPKIKATIITLLFTSIILTMTTDFYAILNRWIFSFNAQGTVALSNSRLKIPLNENESYCSQFTDQNNREIREVSERSDGKYCGQFWRFNTINLMLPYKIINDNKKVYWASPTLTITESDKRQKDK